MTYARPRHALLALVAIVSSCILNRGGLLQVTSETTTAPGGGGSITVQGSGGAMTSGPTTIGPGGSPATGGTGGTGGVGGTPPATGGMGGQGGTGVVCGNGIAEGPEECDDGNLDDGDGCSMNCLVVCPGGWEREPITNHCYDDRNNTLDWDEAVADCAAVGAHFHLATLVDQAEFDFVTGLITSNNYWIGGEDSLVEGTFQWITNEAFTWQNGVSPPWAAGEPSNTGGAQNCLEVLGNTNEFTDRGCGVNLRRICEYTPPGF